MVMSIYVPVREGSILEESDRFKLAEMVPMTTGSQNKLWRETPLIESTALSKAAGW
jgi:hypothetical protein